MLDNVTENFGFKENPRKKTTIKDNHIPHCVDGQWYYGYEKVYMRRHKTCTFPLYNGKMDTSNTENHYE